MGFSKKLSHLSEEWCPLAKNGCMVEGDYWFLGVEMKICVKNYDIDDNYNDENDVNTLHKHLL